MAIDVEQSDCSAHMHAQAAADTVKLAFTARYEPQALQIRLRVGIILALAANMTPKDRH